MEGELRFVGGWRPELGGGGGSSWCGLAASRRVQVDSDGGRPVPSAEARPVQVAGGRASTSLRRPVCCLLTCEAGDGGGGLAVCSLISSGWRAMAGWWLPLLLSSWLSFWCRHGGGLGDCRVHVAAPWWCSSVRRVSLGGGVAEVVGWASSMTTSGRREGCSRAKVFTG
jgi:hypothetical protein